MVSSRCILFVKTELERLGLQPVSVDLGEVELPEQLAPPMLEKLITALKKSGLEVIYDKKSVLIERIKNAIIELIHQSEETKKVCLPTFLSEKLNYNYTYLSNLFKEVQETTIEHYIILQKIERVKELILYDEFNLSEISFQLHYSSVGHLSNQFKQITGMTPSEFRTLKGNSRINLEDVR